jgi:hypothetical protein
MSVNGVSVTNLPAYAWYRVRVEGRSQLLPKERMKALFTDLDAKFGGESWVSTRQESGTYRAWYERFTFSARLTASGSREAKSVLGYKALRAIWERLVVGGTL